MMQVIKGEFTQVRRVDVEALAEEVKQAILSQIEEEDLDNYNDVQIVFGTMMKQKTGSKSLYCQGFVNVKSWGEHVALVSWLQHDVLAGVYDE